MHRHAHHLIILKFYAMNETSILFAIAIISPVLLYQPLRKPPKPKPSKYGAIAVCAKPPLKSRTESRRYKGKLE